MRTITRHAAANTRTYMCLPLPPATYLCARPAASSLNTKSLTMPITNFHTPDPYEYLNGFNSYHE